MTSMLGSCRSKDPRTVPERCAEPAPRIEDGDPVQLVEEQARSPRPYQEVAIVGAIRLFSALDPTTFAGHAVDLADVPVRAAAGQGLWVGFGPHSELFLVPLHAGQLAGIEAGDRIAIRATVQELPEAKDDAKRPELAPARARGEKVYLEASEVTKLGPAVRGLSIPRSPRCRRGMSGLASSRMWRTRTPSPECALHFRRACAT